jgi:hypothetical protein
MTTSRASATLIWSFAATKASGGRDTRLGRSSGLTLSEAIGFGCE